ncbi:MAG TPA: hypothetical protein VG818_09880, partial [Gemmatimonadaceae bacterium]|nr:hypothetical protein [Gemmatimonadaceae bacterium]
TPDQPLEVRLDPWHTTYDWDRRNDVAGPNPLGLGGAQAVFDWPFLDQSNRDHALVALSPMAWYSNGGAMTIGVRARTNYAGLVDRYDFGLAVGTASRTTARGLAPSGASRVQAWWRFENPYPGFASAPLIGLSGGAALLDGIARVDLSQRWDLSPLWTARGPQVSASLGATGAYPYDRAMLPEGWDDRALTELHGTFGIRVPRALLADSGYSSVDAGAGVGVAAHAPSTYGRAELTARSANYWNGGANALLLRAYGALSSATPAQAALHLSAESPLETFANDWYRPQGAILKRPGVNFLPFGGAGLRAYDPMVTVRRILAVNGEMAQRLVPMFFDRLSLWGSVFGDAGFASSTTYTLDGAFLADAGAGLAVRGKLYDRDVTLRLDVPLFAHQPALAGGRGLTKSGADVAARWVFSFSDLW